MKPKELEKKITLGFKILSGYYQGGISREDISKLGDLDSIQWGTKELENTFNTDFRQPFIFHKKTTIFASKYIGQ